VIGRNAWRVFSPLIGQRVLWADTFHTRLTLFLQSIDGVRSIVIDERLRELEPLAWKFVHDFAKDNNLKTESDLATDPLKRH